MSLKYFAVFILLFFTETIDDSHGLCTSYAENVRCKQISDMFENAIIEKEDNKFALQSLFYPSNQYPASTFIARYMLLLPPSDKELNITMFRSWSKSNAYTIASPIMLETLFSGLTYPYLKKISHQNTHFRTFVLNITYQNHSFTNEEIN